ncbi:MAG: MBL fold metallo-hydrolase [Deltaproteobacteria bacterium]|nr:MBL fold metallo-hydrolase [Deltaproteobacteria bacterium]
MTHFVRFWGVRGSVPCPGPATAEVGGNTSCVEVRLGGERILLDGGTGLRQLGLRQAGLPLEATLLFGHLHWDHIQGVPFCAPLYHPQSRVRLVGPQGLLRALATQMSGGPTFPIGLEALSAQLAVEPIDAGARFRVGSVEIATTALRHPGGVIGYRLTAHGRSVVYACDVEHAAEGLDAPLVELARGADLLVYDAQYLPEEYPAKVGWGHSTFERGAALARAAGVGQLALTHHDPSRTDAAVAELEARARALFPRTVAAREGLTLRLDADEGLALAPAGDPGYDGPTLER